LYARGTRRETKWVPFTEAVFDHSCRRLSNEAMGKLFALHSVCLFSSSTCPCCQQGSPSFSSRRRSSIHQWRRQDSQKIFYPPRNIPRGHAYSRIRILLTLSVSLNCSAGSAALLQSCVGSPVVQEPVGTTLRDGRALGCGVMSRNICVSPLTLPAPPFVRSAWSTGSAGG